MSRLAVAIQSAAILTVATVAHGAVANETTGGWIPWLVLGAIGLLVAGIALKMFLSARFAKGYGAWARSKRDSFAARNEQWDNDDDRR